MSNTPMYIVCIPLAFNDDKMDYDYRVCEADDEEEVSEYVADHLEDSSDLEKVLVYEVTNKLPIGQFMSNGRRG